MAQKQHRVTATMIVAKVPGAQGGESYFRKDRILPESVTDKEIKRLTALGLITSEDAVGEPAPAAPAAPEADEGVYKGVPVKDLKAEIERRNAGRTDDAKVSPAEPGNRPEIVAALLADDTN
jgi:hypothetical protein